MTSITHDDVTFIAEENDIVFLMTLMVLTFVFSVKVMIFISDAKGRRWGFSSSSSKGIILVLCSITQWIADLVIQSFVLEAKEG